MRLQEFQHFQFLTENRKVEYINKNMGPKLLQAAEKDHLYKDYQTSEDVVNRLGDMDPSPNKLALQWLANLYARGNFRMEDAARVNHALTAFDERKSTLDPKNRDLMKFKSLADLEDVVVANAETPSPETSKQLAIQAKSNSKRLVDSPAFKVIQPLTMESSCFYGAGTKWCTAARKENKFDEYNDDGPLYIVIASQRKFQMHVVSESFMDERDQPVTKQDIALLSGIPEYQNFLSSLIDTHIIKYAEIKQQELEDEYRDDIENGHTDKYYDEDEDGGYLTGAASYNPEHDDQFPVCLYAWSSHPEKLPGFKEFILPSTALLVKAAINSQMGLAAYHQKIMMKGNPEQLLAYAMNLGRRLPIEAEKIIAKKGDTASDYAIDVMKKRWPEAEDSIFKSFKGYQYIEAFFKQKDPQLEERLLKDTSHQVGSQIVSYCVSIGTRWSEGETKLLEHPDIYCVNYAKKVIKDRWPEFETALVNIPGTDPGYTALRYCIDVLDGRWRDMEWAIMKTPRYAATYAVQVAKQRIPSIEAELAKLPPSQAKTDYEKAFQVTL